MVLKAMQKFAQMALSKQLGSQVFPEESRTSSLAASSGLPKIQSVSVRGQQTQLDLATLVVFSTFKDFVYSSLPPRL